MRVDNFHSKLNYIPYSVAKNLNQLLSPQNKNSEKQDSSEIKTQRVSSISCIATNVSSKENTW